MRLFKGLPPGALNAPPADIAHPIFTGATPIGMISGENPRYPSAPGGHEALKNDLNTLGLKYEETKGRYNIPERSFIVHGPTAEQMYSLGQKYGQDAVIHSENGQHKLILTNGENAGKYHAGLPSYDFWHSHEELPEDYYTELPGHGAFRLHFDGKQLHQLHPLALASGNEAVPQRVAAAPVTKHEIGHALYKQLSQLTKAYIEVDQLPSDPAPGAAKSPMRPFGPYPHAYDWHDGDTSMHYMGHGPGGVILGGNDDTILKSDADSPEHALNHVNDQAAGKGVATYRQFAVPYGSIKDGPSNLDHYNYQGKNDAVNKLVADHGYQPYYAGGKYGKPDLANKNYNTRHLMIYDPSPSSGGDFGNQDYTDSWRKVHELAHALTYPEINRIYGEGRRIGKLGHHRTMNEALRAVHWEWLAGHKQRELNKQLGIEVPDDVFHREMNTLMHDAAHRAVTGKFTEPSAEGFVPHSHKVPLETALNLVREHARNLGLQGQHELLTKGTPVAKKEITIPEALHYLHDGLQKRIEDFAKEALALRKKETEALQKTEKGKQVNTGTFHGKGPHLGSSVQPANPPYHKTGFKKEEVAADNQTPEDSMSDTGGLGGSDNMNMSEKKKVKKGAAADAPGGEQGNPASAAIDSGSGMALNEKKEMKKTLGPRGGVSMGGGAAPAPQPPPPPAPAAPTLPGELAKHDVLCKCGPCGKLESYAKGEMEAGRKGGEPLTMSQPNTFVDNSKGKGKLPPEKGGEKVSPKNHAEGGNTAEITAGKKIAKAGMAMAGAGAMPKAPAAPKMAGSAIPPPHPSMKPMKLPGVSTTPKMPKPPAMGAGSTAGAGVAKRELAKAGPVTLGPRSMEARKKFGERTQKEQAAKLPGVRASTGALMDQMLAAPPSKTAAMAPGTTLPATQGAVPGVGHKPALPAQGVQTMTERVASKMPAGPSALKSPPASMAPGPKSLAVVPSLEHLAAKHTPVAAASKGAPALGELAAQHMAQHAAPKLPGVKPVQTMVERAASKMPAHASLAVPGEKSHQQLLSEARKAETKPYAEPDKNTKTLFEDPEPKVLHPSDKKKKPLEKKHIGFNKLAGELAHEKGVDNPKAVAAAIGRKKYGAKGMAEKAAAARKTEMTKNEYGLALSELGSCALCKKPEHIGPCI